MDRTSDGDGGCQDGMRGGEAEEWGATTTERAELRERRGRARVAAKSSSIRIPRHAPSYHIDLAIVTILSSPAMLGCTIAAGGRGMPENEEPSGRVRRRGREKERGKRAGRSYRMVYHATPRCADVGRRGLNVRESVG